MKTIITFLIIFSLAIHAKGQSISASVISSAGDYYTANGYSLSTTIGETVIDNYVFENTKLSTGFQQGSGNRILYLKFFLEGLFNGIDMNQAYDDIGPHFQAGIADKFQFFLAKNTYPNMQLYTDTAVEISINGNSMINLPACFTGTNYLFIRHRNHMETWSSSPVSFANDIINYDFTTTATKAFGDNQKQVSPNTFAIFVGDVNQDGVVDISDLVAMDADLTNGTLGYIVYDLNGDGVVDISDLVIIDENLTNGVVVMTP
jgi:hypothetical protein